ncbi:MAG: polyprenol monophosphomannose synthase [Bacteroidia bacterium]|nr:polyprenol monophosphomannose synthase [Bacteroidia bacterium]
MKNIVIIPTYNEIENISEMIERVFSLSLPFDILIIDDGSPDGTASVVKNFQQKYNDKLFLIERKSKSGLGTAYIMGFKWCLEKNYDFICEMDCDFSHNPEDLIRLQKTCSENGADLSVGSRYVNNLVNVVNWPMGRVLLSYFASMYVRLITGMKVMDTTAGFVCYSRKVLQKINLDKIKFKGYAFQIEMKFSAIKYGFKLVEIPIIFTDRTAGVSKMSKGIIKEAFWGVIQLKISSWFRNWN